MKVVLLAGGMGTRLSEHTHRIPKPMVEIGGYPILWHIMKGYAKFGITDFVVLLGYKGFLIKQFFADYSLYVDDVTFNLADGSMQRHSSRCEPWNVTLLETGLHTMTGGRIKQAAQHLHGEPFMLTYGDGVANVDVDALLKFHQSHGRAITMTSIQPEGRFGLVDADQNDQVHSFREKPTGDDHWINGGFFVCQPEVLDAIPDNDPSCIFEQQPLRSLAEDGQMMTYRHTGFWQCMDTVRDRQKLVSLWDEGAAPWKVW